MLYFNFTMFTLVNWHFCHLFANTPLKNGLAPNYGPPAGVAADYPLAGMLLQIYDMKQTVYGIIKMETIFS